MISSVHAAIKEHVSSVGQCSWLSLDSKGTWLSCFHPQGWGKPHFLGLWCGVNGYCASCTATATTLIPLLVFFASSHKLSWLPGMEWCEHRQVQGRRWEGLGGVVVEGRGHYL